MSTYARNGLVLSDDLSMRTFSRPSERRDSLKLPPIRSIHSLRESQSSVSPDSLSDNQEPVRHLASLTQQYPQPPIPAQNHHYHQQQYHRASRPTAITRPKMGVETGDGQEQNVAQQDSFPLSIAQSNRSESQQVTAEGREKKDVKRRTKTGCITCRRRRIKCDEAHPSCRNCSKSRRECLGYDPIFKTHSVQSYAANGAYASSTSSSTSGTTGPSTAPSTTDEMTSSPTTKVDFPTSTGKRKDAMGDDPKRALSLRSLCLDSAEEEALERQNFTSQRSTMPTISHIWRARGG